MTLTFVTVFLHNSSFFTLLFLCYHCSMGSVPVIKIDWIGYSYCRVCPSHCGIISTTIMQFTSRGNPKALFLECKDVAEIWRVLPPMRQFDSPYAISYWRSFGTNPLSVTVCEIFNGECGAMIDDLQTKSFILVSIKFLCTTCYRLSIETFPLGRTVKPQYVTLQVTDATLQHKR